MSNIGKTNLHDQSGGRYQCVYLDYLVWWKVARDKEDEPDNRVLECAIEGKAEYIIS